MKQSSRMQMIGAGILGVMLMAWAGADAASATNVLFDFTRTSGDREHYFGTHNEPTASEYDNSPQSKTRFLVQSSLLQGASQSSGWTVLNDTDPDTVNASPSNENQLLGQVLTLRTRITSLTSGSNAQPAYGGFLVGLNGFGNTTADGFFLGVKNTVNVSGELLAASFTDGLRAGTLSSTSFTYGSSGTDYFLELVIGHGDGYELKIFADGDIAGSGNDTNRLVSSDFNTASPVTNLTGALSGYAPGWVGVYFEDDGAPSGGGLNIGNFYADLLIPSAGTVVSIK